MTPTRRHHSAGGVVVAVREGAAHLAVIRPAGRPEGHWTLPKGTVEDGEAPLQSALREVREETGLICEAGGQLPTLRYFFTSDGVRISKTVDYWLMTPIAGGIDAIDEAMRVEVHEARWLPLAAAVRDLAYDDERRLVADVARDLGAA
ncbi:MAG: NUDIX domain-containing protein [Thermoleophilia bacterium]|nr:NUDIX domain-containing protein [Thermoleophilia bacterium]